MRTTFTGVGTALITPFTPPARSTRPPCGGWRGARSTPASHFLVPCGTTGETPTLSAERAAPRRRDRRRRGRRASAGAGRRRRLRHPRGHARRGGDARGRRRRPALGHAVLQQADAGRPVPALQGDRRRTPLPIIVYNVPGRTGCNVEPATLARLATIPTIVGVKEASGNMTQMAEICRAVPDRLPRAVGRRRADAAADGDRRTRHHLGGSNEVPARDGADGRGRRARRLRGRAALAPTSCCRSCRSTSCESSPGPVKFAMAAMGLCEEVFRLPMVPPRPGVAGEGAGGAARARTCRSCRSAARRDAEAATIRHPMSLQEVIEALAAAGASADKAAAREAFRQLQRAAGRRRRARRRARRGVADRLARQRLGQAGHPARLPLRRHRRRVGSRRWPFYDKDTMPLKKPGAARRRPHRARRLDDPRGRVRRHGRRLHAADVRQHRRLRRRRHARRLARAGRIVRADRQARAPQRRRADRRRHRAGGRDAGHRRGRRAGRRQHRHLRGRGGQAARGDRRRHRPHRLDADLRPAATAGSSSPSRASRWSCRRAPWSCPARAR